jgi:hypothetical protein
MESHPEMVFIGKLPAKMLRSKKLWQNSDDLRHYHLDRNT